MSRESSYSTWIVVWEESERGNKHRGIKKNKVTISFLIFMRAFKGWSI